MSLYTTLTISNRIVYCLKEKYKKDIWVNGRLYTEFVDEKLLKRELGNITNIINNSLNNKKLKFLEKIDDKTAPKSVFQFLCFSISKKVQKILNVSNNKNLVTSYHKFLKAIADIRYKVKDDYSSKIEEFLIELEKELDLIDAKEESEMISSDQDVMAFWRTLIENEAVLEAPMWVFSRKYMDLDRAFNLKPNIKSLRLLIKEVLEITTGTIGQFLIPFVKYLDKFETVTHPYFQNEVKRSKTNLQEFLDNHVKMINCDKVEYIVSAIDKLSQLKPSFSKLVDGEGKIDHFGIGDTCMTAGMTGLIIRDIEKTHDPDKDANKKYSFESYDGRTLENLVINIDPKWRGKGTEWTLAELRLYCEYVTENSTCHKLCDTYIQSLYVYLLDPALDALKTWTTENKNWKKLCQDIDEPVLLPPSKNDDVKPVKWDEPTKKIDKTAKQKHGQKIKNEKQDSSSEEIPDEIEEIPEQFCESVVSSPTIIPLPKDVKMVQLMTRQLSLLGAGGHLRNALMYLQDMRIIAKWIERGDKLDPSYLVSQAVNANYRLLEQLLSHLNVMKNATQVVGARQHNLKSLYRLLEPNKTSDIINRLWLAYHWVYYPFVQERYWKQFNVKHTPAVLNMVCDIQRHPEHYESRNIKEVLNGYQKQTHDFLDTVLKEEKEEGSQVVNEESISLTPEKKISLSHLEKLSKQCCKLTKRINLSADHPIFLLFANIEKDIKHLSCAIRQLNQPVQSDEFSFLIRSALRWQQCIMSQLLQGIYELKTSTSTTEHNLGTLVQEISWKKKPTQEQIDFINKFYKKIHHLISYTYDSDTVENEGHELILQAECTRNQPQFLTDFEYTKKSIKDSLNRIEIPSTGMSYASLLKRLTYLLDRSWDLTDNLIMAELELSISN